MPISRNVRILASAISLVVAGCFAADAAEHTSPDEAIALTKSVRADIKAKGLDAIIADINDKKYTDGDLYPFIMKFDGVMVAHGANKALVGKNLIALKDQNGVNLVQKFIDAAKTSGSGWTDYLWSNPTTKKAESKTTYIEKIDDTELVAVGIYKKQ